MTDKLQRSWFAIDGQLEPLDAAWADIRFPDELVALVLEHFTNPGDWVLDPFAGFGTTLRIAQMMGRRAVGFEPDAQRAQYAEAALRAPSRVMYTRAESMAEHDLPAFDLVLTSPPYATVRLEDDPWGPSYFDDMRTIFKSVQKVVRPGANIVVEVSNILTEDGFRPLAFQFADLLSQIFSFRREIVRCNTGSALAGPGSNHSYLLVFENEPTSS